MSRKKVKKEVVKRKTSIYDPMGVYGRGLTENQRLGMTRQMKVENMAIPKPIITRELLKEYGKILEYYGMYPEKPTGTNLDIKKLEVPLTGNSITIDNEFISRILKNEGITPGAFYCDVFAIEKDHSIDVWDPNIGYFIAVGSSMFESISHSSVVEAGYSNDIIPVASYFMSSGRICYRGIVYDSSREAALSDLLYESLSGQQSYADFVNNLPQDGTVVPYLLYPNNSLPELEFGISTLSPAFPDGYKLQIKLVVMY